MKGILKIVSVALIAIVLSLAFVEIGLRLYYLASEKQIIGLDPKRSTLKYYDETNIGRSLIPNQKGWFVPQTKEYTSWVEVNSHGFPDVEHSYEKGADTFRILILGDSFVENLQVPLEQRFFRQLEEKLKNEVNSNVEIIAMGRGNSGTAIQYLMLKHFGVKYQPDLVVHFFLTANDIKNNSSDLQDDPYLPYFSLSREGELVQVPHLTRADRKLSSLKESLKKFRITELALLARQRILESDKNTEYGFPLDYHVYQESYSKEYEKAWEVTKKLILETKSLAEEEKADYLLVTLANNEQVNQSVWSELKKVYPEIKSAELDLQKPDRLLKEYCEEEELSCLFMLPYFKKYINDNSEVVTHNRLEGHWNQTGTDLATKFLFESFENYFSNK